MRPDDRLRFEALDVDLAELDAELDAAGAVAAGRTPAPDRAFSSSLRGRLVASLPAPAPLAAGRTAGADAGIATWLPVRLRPSVSSGPSVRRDRAARRSRWWALAAAAMLVVLGVASAGLGLLRSVPTPTTSPDPSTPLASPRATGAPIVAPPPTDVPSAAPTAMPTSAPTSAPTPTPKPTPAPTKKPTAPPVATFNLAAAACPGAVLLDWAKPAGADHYRVFRKVGGTVGSSYPPAGATEVETAASWDPATTDGYDGTVDGGTSVSYRAFAFDAAEAVVAVSGVETVIAAWRIELGTLTVQDLGPGSILASWPAPGVSAACFTYGKLVASTDNPDPSYVNGDPYIAVIGDPATTDVQVDGLPSGKTVWMRYEVIRGTSFGNVVIARTSVLQVTFP